MKVLLDTHAFLWFVRGDDKLSNAALSIMEDAENHLLLSAASAWEIAIKISLKRKKLKLTEPFQTFMENQLAENRIDILPISLAHAHGVTELPFHHRDPFDRLLAAQALVEEMPIISHDIVFDQYGVTRIWSEQLTGEDEESAP